MYEALTYDDVLLVPQYSEIKSRSEINISHWLDKRIKLNIPIISSPMDTVTEDDMATAIASRGGLGIIHRYNTIEQQCTLAKKALKSRSQGAIGAAIGVTEDYIERAIALHDIGVDVLCIDVAHGHHALMKTALDELRKTFGPSMHLMAGNVATQNGYEQLVDWGADSVRCGIGGGSICSTRIQTGHGIPGLQTIFDCAAANRDVPIIADGGIRNSGDIAKAIAAGADFVMLGSLLAGTEESPGKKIVSSNGQASKVYRGMASRDAQSDWRGHLTSAPEGVSVIVPYKGSVKPILTDLTMGLRSGLSYTGARTIVEFQSKAKFLKQSGAGQVESVPHIARANK